MKKRISVAIIVILYSIMPVSGASVINEINTVVATISDSIAANNKKIVAVTDFTDLEGNVNVLGRFIAEEISLGLASTGKQFAVVDRNQIKKALAEKNISIAGVIDPSFAKQIGQISGAEVILTGSVYPFSDSVYLSAKIIDVSTARIIGGTSMMLSKNQILDDLVQISFKTSDVKGSTQEIPIFSPQVKEAANYILILKDIAMNDNSVILNLEIKNNFDQGRYLTVKSIRAIDDSGREYFPSSFTIAGTTAYIGDAGKIQSVIRGAISENFDVWLHEYQQVKAQIVIKNILSKSKTIGILEMVIAPVNIMNSHGTFMRLEDDPSTIQFSNLSIIRKNAIK
ncbi:MAG: FlgO family outer membrane protein [Candidatus Ratteibacteria bacterium]